MSRLLAAALLMMLPGAAMAQVDWSIASHVQPPHIMTPAEMQAGRFLSPPPVVQYYAAPVQQPTNCTTNYLRDTNGRAISSYTTCN